MWENLARAGTPHPPPRWSAGRSARGTTTTAARRSARRRRRCRGARGARSTPRWRAAPDMLSRSRRTCGTACSTSPRARARRASRTTRRSAPRSACCRRPRAASSTAAHLEARDGGVRRGDRRDRGADAELQADRAQGRGRARARRRAQRATAGASTAYARYEQRAPRARASLAPRTPKKPEKPPLRYAAEMAGAPLGPDGRVANKALLPEEIRRLLRQGRPSIGFFEGPRRREATSSPWDALHGFRATPRPDPSAPGALDGLRPPVSLERAQPQRRPARRVGRRARRGRLVAAGAAWRQSAAADATATRWLRACAARVGGRERAPRRRPSCRTSARARRWGQPRSARAMPAPMGAAGYKKEESRARCWLRISTRRRLGRYSPPQATGPRRRQWREATLKHATKPACTATQDTNAETTRRRTCLPSGAPSRGPSPLAAPPPPALTAAAGPAAAPAAMGARRPRRRASAPTATTRTEPFARARRLGAVEAMRRPPSSRRSRRPRTRRPPRTARTCPRTGPPRPLPAERRERRGRGHQRIGLAAAALVHRRNEPLVRTGPKTLPRRRGRRRAAAAAAVGRLGERVDVRVVAVPAGESGPQLRSPTSASASSRHGRQAYRSQSHAPGGGAAARALARALARGAYRRNASLSRARRVVRVDEPPPLDVPVFRNGGARARRRRGGGSFPHARSTPRRGARGEFGDERESARERERRARVAGCFGTTKHALPPQEPAAPRGRREPPRRGRRAHPARAAAAPPPTRR